MKNKELGMMNIETKILETMAKMPISIQEELLHYAQYLEEKYSKNNIIQSNNLDVADDFRKAWHEAMIGQTIPVSQLWEETDDDG